MKNFGSRKWEVVSDYQMVQWTFVANSTWGGFFIQPPLVYYVIPNSS